MQTMENDELRHKETNEIIIMRMAWKNLAKSDGECVKIK